MRGHIQTLDNYLRQISSYHTCDRALTLGNNPRDGKLRSLQGRTESPEYCSSIAPLAKAMLQYMVLGWRSHEPSRL